MTTSDLYCASWSIAIKWSAQLTGSQPNSRSWCRSMRDHHKHNLDRNVRRISSILARSRVSFGAYSTADRMCTFSEHICWQSWGYLPWFWRKVARQSRPAIPSARSVVSTYPIHRFLLIVPANILSVVQHSLPCLARTCTIQGRRNMLHVSIFESHCVLSARNNQRVLSWSPAASLTNVSLAPTGNCLGWKLMYS